MLSIQASARFRRDFKRCEKRRLDMTLLEAVVNTLRIPEPLPRENNDHALAGSFAGYRECHVQSDWLLLYRVKEDRLELLATGTHSDLFKK